VSACCRYCGSLYNEELTAGQSVPMWDIHSFELFISCLDTISSSCNFVAADVAPCSFTSSFATSIPVYRLENALPTVVRRSFPLHGQPMLLDIAR
jgi:hypothetical protein